MTKYTHEHYDTIACQLVKLDPSEDNIQGILTYFGNQSVDFDEAKFRDCIKHHMAIECVKEYLKEQYEDYLEECDADWGIEDGETQVNIKPMSYDEFVAQYVYEGAN